MCRLCKSTSGALVRRPPPFSVNTVSFRSTPPPTIHIVFHIQDAAGAGIEVVRHGQAQGRAGARVQEDIAIDATLGARRGRCPGRWQLAYRDVPGWWQRAWERRTAHRGRTRPPGHAPTVGAPGGGAGRRWMRRCSWAKSQQRSANSPNASSHATSGLLVPAVWCSGGAPAPVDPPARWRTTPRRAAAAAAAWHRSARHGQARAARRRLANPVPRTRGSSAFRRIRGRPVGQAKGSTNDIRAGLRSGYTTSTGPLGQRPKIGSKICRAVSSWLPSQPGVSPAHGHPQPTMRALCRGIPRAAEGSRL